MSTEAVAEALAPQEQTENPDIAGQLDEIWSKYESSQEETPEIPEEAPVEEKPVEPEAAAPEPEQKEEATPQVDVPTELPGGIKAQWATMSPEAREAVLSSHRELGNKLAEQGKLVSGISPIRDALVEMVQDVPEMKDLKPEQVIAEMRSFMNDTIAPFKKDPVGTMLKAAQQGGFAEQLRAALGGEKPAPQSQMQQELTNVIKGQSQQIEQLREALAELQQAPVKSVIEEFASSAEHWNDVASSESFHQAIAYYRTDPNLSEKEVLGKAYDLELQRLGKAKPVVSEEEEPKADPERTEKALKAKSVNVQDQPSKPKELTERQIMEKVWRKHHS